VINQLTAEGTAIHRRSSVTLLAYSWIKFKGSYAILLPILIGGRYAVLKENLFAISIPQAIQRLARA
jgi:hypothetical protein